MKLRHNILWISLLAILMIVSCNRQQKVYSTSFYVDSITVADSLLVLEPPMRKGAISFDSIVDEVSYLPLSTNDTVLISTISDIKICKNRIYIADYKLSKLFSFDSEGKFIGCIDAVGEGPEEYKRICGFDVDEKNDLLYLLDGDLGKIHVYDTSLNFCKIIQLPITFVDHLALYDEHRCYLERGLRGYDENEDKTPNLIFYNFETNQIEHAHFYFKNSSYISYMNQDPVAFSFSQDKLYYWPILASSIYSCTDSGISKVIDVDMGEYEIPSYLLSEKMSNVISMMSKHFYSYIDRFYEFDHWIYLRISRIHGSAHYFYNKQHQKGYIDISFVKSTNGKKMIAPDLFFVSEEMCCGYIAPEQYLSFTENNEKVEIDNNPILVFYKLK